MRADEGIGFSARTKEELVRLPLGKNCCMLSEISGYTRSVGRLAFRGGGNFSVQYRLENTGSARRLYLLLKKRLGLSPALHFVHSPRLGGQRTCILTLEEGDSRELLTALHMMETDEEGRLRLRRATPRHPMTRQCCRRAFLRGAFLGAGSVTNPARGYRLEWKAEDDPLPADLEKLLGKCDLPYHCYQRKGVSVIYLQGAQRVADALALLGAGNSVLELENTRIRKQIRAAAVRAANCDEHNGERMLDAAQHQAAEIGRIVLKRGLFSLPPALREMARLRMENPDLSLKELGEAMDPPLGKSAVNHRLRRLMEIARELGEEET